MLFHCLNFAEFRCTACGRRRNNKQKPKKKNIKDVKIIPKNEIWGNNSNVKK